MSGIAIVSVAAVCAGYLWLERHQVRRDAKLCTRQRRELGALQWCEPAPVLEHPASKLLERRLEEAVGSADFACAYHRRLFLRGASGESPFQLRRARVDSGQRRFAQAAERLKLQAVAWLSCAELDPDLDEQSKLAVTRMHEWLGEHPVSKRFPVGDDQVIVATIDLFENVLANLRRRRAQASGADPFRHGVDATMRQDVTLGVKPVSSRHDGALPVAARR